MALLRHQPGEMTPRTGTYALVGHYGEPTGFAAWLEAGERLPLVAAGVVDGPLWYVLVDDSTEVAQAA